MVGTARKWQPSLDRGAWQLNRGLISHSLRKLFRGNDYWPLNGGWPLTTRWPLNGGATVYRVGW